MAETFGVLAGAAGLAGVLITLPEIAYSKSKILANVVNELHHCKDHMHLVDLKLQNWKNIWRWPGLWERKDKAASQEIYELFWSSEGFAEVKRILETVGSERKCVDDFFQNEKVKSLMQRPDGQQETEEPGSEILELDEELVQLWHHLSDKMGDWKVKMAHTNYKGVFLKERVGNIEKSIDRLNESTRYRYWMTLDADGDANRPVDPKSLERTGDLSTEYKAAVEEMKAWEKETEEKAEQWRLVLGKPSPEVTLQNLGDGLGFDLDFVVKASEQYQVRTITISPREKCLTKAYVTKSYAIGLDSIRTMLNSPLSEGTLRIRFGSHFRKAATCLVRSTVLLHRAPWTRNLCNCGIFFVDVEHAATGLCTFMKPRDPDACCHLPGTEEHRFTRLARALTELCMGKTMLYQRFVELGDPRRALLGEIIGQAGREYKIALQSCLDLATYERNVELIRPERIERALEEIMKP